MDKETEGKVEEEIIAPPRKLDVNELQTGVRGKNKDVPQDSFREQHAKIVHADDDGAPPLPSVEDDDDAPPLPPGAGPK